MILDRVLLASKRIPSIGNMQIRSVVRWHNSCVGRLQDRSSNDSSAQPSCGIRHCLHSGSLLGHLQVADRSWV